MALDPDLKDLAQAKNFAALTTLMPDGHPQTQIMWVGADDEHVIINTQLDRQKYRNVFADPRVTVTVFDADNPYRYVEARGRVARTQDGGERWEQLREGLPQDCAHDVVYRHALDSAGDLLAVGSTTGNLYVSENRGESWFFVATNLPPIYSVRFG